MTATTTGRFIRLLPWLGFAALIIVMHYRIFGSAFNYGDNWALWSSAIHSPWSTWNINFFGLNASSVMFSVPLAGIFYKLFNAISLPITISSPIFTLVPLYLFIMSIYYGASDMAKDKRFGLLAALFVLTSSFTFDQLIYWPGSYFWSALCIWNGIWLSYRWWHEHDNRKIPILLGLNGLLCFHPFILTIYALFIVFLAFGIRLNDKNNRAIVGGLKAIGIAIFLNSFWIVSFLASYFLPQVQEMYLGNQESVFSGYRISSGAAHILRFLHYPGTTAESNLFNIPNIILYILILIIIALVIARQLKNRNRYSLRRSYTFFCLVVWVVFMSLALGPNSSLFGGLWLWGFENIPGFSFLRSFTRFIVVAFLMIIPIVMQAYTPLNEKIKKWLFALGIIVLIAINPWIFSGDLNGLISGSRVPQEYYDLNETYLSDDELYNVIAFPNIPYETYTWSINRQDVQYPQTFFFQQNFLSKPVIYNSNSFNIDLNNSELTPMFQINLTTFNPDRELFDKLGAKYVLIHKDYINFDTVSRTTDLSPYYNYFDNDDHYTIIEDNDYFRLYKLNDYTTVISGDGISTRLINETAYYISTDSQSDRLVFRQNYDPNWKLIKIDSNEPICTTKTKCRYNWLKLLLLNPDTAINNDGSNSWSIESNSQYILFFWPQRYFYYGILATILGLLGFAIGYIMIKNHPHES